jgi:formylglycine-generating enzyme required for sulfatase activity
MGANPSRFTGDPRLPVEQVSWDDICGPDGFLARLNALTEGARPDGQVFRLPTEAEWGYACRAGTDTAYSFGNDPADLGDHGWFNDNAEGRTHPAGHKKPNPWGLHDLHGNMWEWCCVEVRVVRVTAPLAKGGSLVGTIVCLRESAFRALLAGVVGGHRDEHLPELKGSSRLASLRSGFHRTTSILLKKNYPMKAS